MAHTLYLEQASAGGSTKHIHIPFMTASTDEPYHVAEWIAEAGQLARDLLPFKLADGALLKMEAFAKKWGAPVQRSDGPPPSFIVSRMYILESGAEVWSSPAAILTVTGAVRQLDGATVQVPLPVMEFSETGQVDDFELQLATLTSQTKQPLRLNRGGKLRKEHPITSMIFDSRSTHRKTLEADSGDDEKYGSTDVAGRAVRRLTFTDRISGRVCQIVLDNQDVDATKTSPFMCFLIGATIGAVAGVMWRLARKA